MRVTCPYCGVVGKGPSNSEGKTIHCGSCKQAFTVESPIHANTLTYESEPVRQTSFNKGFGATWGVLTALGLAGMVIVACGCIGLLFMLNTTMGTSANKTFGQVAGAVGGAGVGPGFVPPVRAIKKPQEAKKKADPPPPKNVPQEAKGKGVDQVKLRLDAENVEVAKVLDALKTPDNQAALETVVKHAKDWNTKNCIQVAQELANIRENKSQVSRALCEIIASLQPAPLADDSAKQPQRVALASLEKVNSRLYHLVMDFLTVKYGRGSDVARKFLDRRDDGKAATPILRERVTHFANGQSAGSTVFETFGDEVLGCVDVLMVVAHDDPETLEAVVGLLRAYQKRAGTPTGYHPNSSAVSRIGSLIDHVGSCGSQAKHAAPILQSLKFDENARIRKAAGDALVKVSQ